MLLCQFEGITVAPIREAKDVPNDPTLLFMFAFIERKWLLYQPFTPKKKESDYPDRVQGVLLCQSNTNLRELVDMIQHGLKSVGISLYWKKVQAKESAVKCTIIGSPPELDTRGIEVSLQHHLKLARNYLIDKGVIDFNLIDAPLPEFSAYVKKHNEARLPTDVYEEIKHANLKGYNRDIGIKMLVLEMSNKSWNDIGPLMIHLNDIGMLQMVCGRQCVLHENPDGRLSIDETIEMQRNKNGHFRYSAKMNYESMNQIATIDKRVEMYYEDGRKPEKKFSTLREMFMGLVNPKSGLPLIEGITPVPSSPGKIQIMFFSKNGMNHDWIKAIKRSPAAFWWFYMKDMGLAEGCRKRHMDAFVHEHRAVAQLHTWDADSWTVRPLGGGRIRGCFADEIEDLLSDDDDEPVTNGILNDADDLLATMKDDDDDLNLGKSGDAASVQTNGTGSSSVNVANAARLSAQKLANKELQDRLEAEVKEKEEMKKQIQLLLEQQRAMSAALANQQHVPPRDSGGAAAGVSPPHQDTGGGGSAAAQG